jgi:hypothetical protein
MKVLFSFSAALLMLMFSAKEASIYLLFKLDQQNIIEKFCINKDKPELNCGGCCYLKDKLDENAEKENQFPGTQSNSELHVLFLENRKEKKIILTSLELQFYLVCKRKPVSSKNSIFHPPRYIS